MRRGELVPRAFQAPVDVHASADGQVYMFKRKPHESADSSDDDELNVMEMRPRIYHEQEAASNVQLVEREVMDGDNLNKLALQYGCKVADIKRINNLIQEQDLFALKSIKIPVQKHSFLTETYSDFSDLHEEMHDASGAAAAAAAKPRDRSREHPDDVSDFLMEVDNDIERLIQTTDERDFLDLSERPRHFGFKGQRFSAHGADCGIQWWNAVIAMVLIGIALPLFYLIYFKTVSSGAALPADGSGASRAAASNSSGTDFGT